MKKKIAVILFNLGGPEKLSSVEGFLFNLFYDPAILPLPNPFRWLLAKFITLRRKAKSQNIYANIGGGSPILSLTENQAKLLEKKLNSSDKNSEYKVFVSMRYWHPFAKETINLVEKFYPDEMVLLPLYPQYSTTTTKSSFDEFKRLIQKSKLKEKKQKPIYHYFDNENFIKAHVSLIEKLIPKKSSKFRILFSAHGLPEYVIKNGDPYQIQIEKTIENIINELGKKIDHVVCYQSKVGPLKWLGPNTEDELIKAAKEDMDVMIVPIAFVSEHSETLYELDIEYKELFEKICQKEFIRVPALNDNKYFIQALADEVLSIENRHL